MPNSRSYFSIIVETKLGRESQIQTGEGRVGQRTLSRTYPPPFQNGKGAGRLTMVTVVQVNVLFEEGLSFSPLGETGEGFGIGTSPRLW